MAKKNSFWTGRKRNLVSFYRVFTPAQIFTGKGASFEGVASYGRRKYGLSWKESQTYAERIMKSREPKPTPAEKREDVKIRRIEKEAVKYAKSKRKLKKVM